MDELIIIFSNASIVSPMPLLLDLDFFFTKQSRLTFRNEVNKSVSGFQFLFFQRSPFLTILTTVFRQRFFEACSKLILQMSCTQNTFNKYEYVVWKQFFKIIKFSVWYKSDCTTTTIYSRYELHFGCFPADQLTSSFHKEPLWNWQVSKKIFWSILLPTIGNRFWSSTKGCDYVQPFSRRTERTVQCMR